ncbi:DUF2061 domain-containing protein [Halobacteriaceae archaeon GCM10025711]
MQGSGWLSRRAHQRRSRAVAKTVLYRAFMVVITVVVAYVVTGQVADAVNIGVATNLVKTGTYYAYERVWDHVSWGTAPA